MPYNVMIVDDEEIIRLELKRSINWSEYGFSTPIEAENGLEAINMLNAKPMDLIISDIKMPVIDGIELLKEVKNKSLSSCVVFLSGYSDFEYARQGIVLGAFDFIVKPVEREKVIEVLKRASDKLDKISTLEEERKKVAMKLGETLSLLYPKEEGKQLLSVILSGDASAVTLAEDLILDVASSTNGDSFKASVILGVITSNIIQVIAQKYPALSNTLSIYKNRFSHSSESENIDILKKHFISMVSELVDIIVGNALNIKDNVINQVCEYIMANPDKDITLKSIADKFLISKNYLSYLFKQETGENFVDYLTRVKMEHAKTLLKEGNYKTYEVSSLLGYRETSYFSRLFKKYTGFYPTEYRKSV